MVQKDKNLCKIIDFACAYDGRVDTKELEKIEHYQDWAWELRKIWNMKVKVIPLVIGSPWNNTHKVTKLVKGNRYWNSDNRVAENGPSTQCSNPLEGSWGLRKLVVIGPKELWISWTLRKVDLSPLLKQCVRNQMMMMMMMMIITSTTTIIIIIIIIIMMMIIMKKLIILLPEITIWYVD